MRKFLLILAIFFLILFIGYFGLSLFNLEKSKPKEIENHSPQVGTSGVQTGCGTAIADLFFYFLDPDQNDKMTAYQIQVDDNSDFSNCPGENCPFDTGKETKILETLKSYDSSYRYSFPKKLPQKVYFWRVKVWDKNDAPSDWAKAILDLTR